MHSQLMIHTVKCLFIISTHHDNSVVYDFGSVFIYRLFSVMLSLQFGWVKELEGTTLSIMVFTDCCHLHSGNVVRWCQFVGVCVCLLVNFWTVSDIVIEICLAARYGQSLDEFEMAAFRWTAACLWWCSSGRTCFDSVHCIDMN